MDAVQEKVTAATQQNPQQVSQLAYICYFGSLFSVLLSVVLWLIPADDEAKKARGERLAIFVGLWPPTLAVVGKVIEDRAREAGGSR